MSYQQGGIAGVNIAGGVTVSGTVTANAGTNLNTSALALEAGNLATIKSKTDNLDVALSTRATSANQTNGSHKTQLVDASGHVVEATLDSAGEYHLGVATIQSVYADTHNSSVANLNAGATFTGTSTTSLGIAGIQVNLKADQNCTVYVDQSMDNSNWDITDTYNYYYSVGGQSWTTQATASYLRVRVKNIGASATTYLRLQTALCPIVEAVPRALSPAGNLKTAVNEIYSQNFNNWAEISPVSELRVSEHVRLVGTTFIGTTLDTNFWATTLVGTGTVSLIAGSASGDGEATLSTGVTSASTALLQSVRTSRYVSGSSNYFRAVMVAPSVTGANTRRWGCYDANNGFFFEHDGTTLSVVCRKNTSDTNKISSAAFNGTLGATYTLDTNAHTYEIHYTNRSAWFMVDGLLLHKFTGATASLSASTNLKISIENNNGTNTNDNKLVCRVASISRIGTLHSLPIYKYISGAANTVCKLSTGYLHRVIINSKSSINGTAIIYDNTAASGTTMATLDTYNQYGSIEFGCPFFTGLSIATNKSDSVITVVYE